jgi:hypothetical protein
VVDRVQPFGALPENRMGIGIGINSTMQDYSFMYEGRKIFRFVAMDIVGHKVAYLHQLIITRKIYMC